MGRELLVLGPTLVRMTFVLTQRLLEKMVPPHPLPGKCPSPGMPWVALVMAAIVTLAELPLG